ncbi:XRE family transcriptional regulator [Methylorubrum extorquens]
MGRSLNDVIAALPPEEQATIETGYQDLKQEVEGLRELRQIAGKAQAEIASALNIKQPSVSQIERQTDMYLSTLRSYIEAIGGQLELTVTLPACPVLKLHSIGEVTAPDAATRPLQRRRKASTAR